jgi:hypothetical protein
MGRSASAIQLEIDNIEAQLATIYAGKSLSADGVSKTNHDIEPLTKRLDLLYAQLGRANGNSPRELRGRVEGAR